MSISHRNAHRHPNLHPHRTARLLLVVMLLLIPASCGSAPKAQGLRFDSAPWQGGEISRYTVAANKAETTGTALFSVQGDSETWNLERRLTALGDEETATIEVAGSGFRPQLSTLVRTLTGGGVERVQATYTSGTVDLELTTKQLVTTVQRFNIPTDARDQRTLPFLVRALPLAEGYVTRINAFLPITGALDRYTISVVGREKVTVPAGEFESWRVRLDTGATVSHLWVGVTAPFPIVKFDDGRANATYDLLEFTPGG